MQISETKRRNGSHTERGTGIWEHTRGLVCRVGCGATVFVLVDVGSEVGGRGKEPKEVDVDGVFGETDRSDPEGELVKSVVASSSSSESLHLDEQLTRARFQEMTADLLERCRKPFEAAIKDAGINVSAIDHVVLVGGSTRMPAVSDLVRELTGGK